MWEKVKRQPSVLCTIKNDEKHLKNELFQDHCYSAINCDKGAETVTLRNSWEMVSQNTFWAMSKDGEHGVLNLENEVFQISFTNFKK